MRYLNFTEADEQKFSIIYTGILDSKRGFSDSETRVIGNVLDKLEKVASPVEQDNRATFALSEPGEVALEDAEYRLMIDALRAVKWTARFSRQVADTFDWLKDAPTKERVSAR